MSLPGFRVNAAASLARASIIRALEHVVGPHLRDDLVPSVRIAVLYSLQQDRKTFRYRLHGQVPARQQPNKLQSAPDASIGSRAGYRWRRRTE